jgi:competence protein ComEA
MRRRRALTLLAGLPALDAHAITEPAPLERNAASRAQLESLQGIGRALAGRILAAREAGPFTGWADLRRRVRGIGPALARRLSDQGLRIQGQALPD